MFRAALALPLALAACSTAAPDPRGVDRDEVLVQIAAGGRAEARPDEARMTIGVESIEANAAAASEANAETMGRVVSALRELGVAEDDLQTRSLTLGRIDYGRDRGRFRANNLVEVRMRDVTKAGRAVAAATEAGGNVLDGPRLTVADPEAASRSAYAAAYRAARARADAYAEAAGLRVVRVLAIRDAGEGRDPYRGAMDSNQNMAPMVAMEVAQEPPVAPGMNRSEVRVRVDFALAE